MNQRKPKLLQVRLIGDKTLKQKAKPIEKITQEILDFAQDLTYTMYEKDGVGLAAPQVGVSIRMFVIDPFWGNENSKKNPMVLINPKFTLFEGEVDSEEGCLSIPEVFETVKRAEKVKMEALNLQGKLVTYEADELFGRALQHEYDHLEGILFTDKVVGMKKLLLRKKLKALMSTTDENGINVGYETK